MGTERRGRHDEGHARINTTAIVTTPVAPFHPRRTDFPDPVLTHGVGGDTVRIPDAAKAQARRPERSRHAEDRH